MTPDARKQAQDLARQHLAKGDPTGWFDALYSKAQGDADQIPWADLKPNSNLTAWLKKTPGQWKQALVVGCGLGDDAEELARLGCDVTAFDISPTAIGWCRRRFPDSPVHYQVADLFDLPATWKRKFDFVFECFTLQALPPDVRTRAASQLIESIMPGGTLLVVCRAREESEPLVNVPWPLTLKELRQLLPSSRLAEVALEDYLDDESVRRFRAEYRAPD